MGFWFWEADDLEKAEEIYGVKKGEAGFIDEYDIGTPVHPRNGIIDSYDLQWIESAVDHHKPKTWKIFATFMLILGIILLVYVLLKG